MTAAALLYLAKKLTIADRPHPASTHPTGPNDYDILRLLGRGHFARVFLCRKAKGPDINRFYAIKASTIANEKRHYEKLMRMEYSAMMVVHSPFVLKAVDAFRTQKAAYIVTELALSGDLLSLMKGWVKFTEDQARFYLAEIALGIGHIHEAGIIHKDIKPENILLDREGHCRVADLGLCIMGEESSLRSGTPWYMSPEVTKSEPHNNTVDWWAYGLIAYELFVGKMLFYIKRSEPKRDELKNIYIQYTKWPFPDYLSEEARQILGFCIERDPSLRPGAKENGLHDLSRMPYFRGVDWSKVLNKQLKPPFHRVHGTSEKDWIMYRPIPINL